MKTTTHDASELPVGLAASNAGDPRQRSHELILTRLASRGQVYPSEITDEMFIVNTLFAQLESLRETDEAYFTRFEDADLDTAPRTELLALMASAPNDPVKFFILGKYSARLMSESVTRWPR